MASFDADQNITWALSTYTSCIHHLPSKTSYALPLESLEPSPSPSIPFPPSSTLLPCTVSPTYSATSADAGTVAVTNAYGYLKLPYGVLVLP
eukprot:CAMPEP_0182472290 /NCGR_PEP_ID=MMETSP1319-20130603/21893_1 /TAXON_ID=172717 /ORGANISM="Bolidomonas pacifica, Strain RCC208" /LENGTH=91 /DNA_ID=CAMNT_0024672949 /DNA_START=127 /DNA_END=398 /DNA_ORIENTATION=+